MWRSVGCLAVLTYYPPEVLFCHPQSKNRHYLAGCCDRIVDYFTIYREQPLFCGLNVGAFVIAQHAIPWEL